MKIIIIVAVMALSVLVQCLLWPYLNQHGWTLLYPAVFFTILIHPWYGFLFGVGSTLLAEHVFFVEHDPLHVALFVSATAVVAVATNHRSYRDRLSFNGREQELANFQGAFANSPMPLAINDINGRILHVNAAFERTFGYTGLTHLEQWWPLAYPDPVYRDRVRDSWLERTSTGASIEDSCYEVTCADGTVKTVLISASVSGSNLLVSFADVTDVITTRNQLTILHTAIEQSPTSVVITDLNATIQYVNPQFTEVTGYSREEAIGSDPRILKSGLTPTEVYEDMWNNLTNGRPWHGVLYNKRKNGETYVEDAHISPVVVNGAVRHYVAVKFDKTEQVNAEMAARKEVEKTDVMFKIACEGIHVLDMEGRLVMANPAFCRHLGYSEQEVLELNVSDWDAQWNSEELLEKLSQIRRTEGIEFETLHRCKDGTIKTVEVSSRSLDYDGRQLVYNACRDITDKKRAEATMRLAARVFDSSSEGIVVTSPESRILQVNRAFTDITGYSEADVLGLTPSILNSGVHDKAFYESMWEALSTNGIWQGEVWNKRKDGTIYPEWLTISVIRDDAGAVLHYVGVFADISKWKETEKTIWSQANYDALTGLPNRRLFLSTLDREIGQSSRFALFFLDLDRFKEVNDSLGHDHGDLLLQDAGKRLKSCVRDTDMVARLGGDEFTVLIPNIPSCDTARNIAASILRKLSAPFQLNSHTVYVSASVGVTFYPDDAIDATGLIKCADQAMYTAKYAGRNQMSFYTEEMNARTSHRLRLANDLRQALAKGQMSVVYQPVVDLNTGTVVKVEALLRWQHPELGFVSPMEFIPIAEDTGLIHDIGLFVLKDAVALSKLIGPNITIAVNKSPVQFQRPSIEWCELIESSGASLCIEITEGVLLEASDVIINKLLHYKAIGVAVAVDDFGTGYSNLAYLKRFDVDVLKIDQSFVRNLAEGSDDLILCEAMIVMAHRLGISVIAEGVETGLQRDLLRSVGCDRGQGYLFSRPLSVDALLEFINSPVGGDNE